jgi:hypothetical protein
MTRSIVWVGRCCRATTSSLPRLLVLGALVQITALPALADSEKCATGTPALGMPASFHLTPRTELLRHVAAADTSYLRRHAMTIWAALTDVDSSRSPNLHFFETWPTKQETFSRNLKTVFASPFALPAQLGRNVSQVPAAGAVNDWKVFTAVRYNCAAYRYIRQRGLYEPAMLGNLNLAAQNLPIGRREIPFLPRSAIMIKPAFQVVSHQRPTTLGYWAGPHNSSAPDAPGPTTWTEKIIVVPPGVSAPLAGPRDGPVVGLDRFFWRKLGSDDVTKLKTDLGINWLTEGDYAILVAMHVATHELTNWTWQTFWWSFQRPRATLLGRTRIRPPFDNYELEIGYDFMTPAGNSTGLTNRAFNPYLEAEFNEQAFSRPGQRGIESNCMSCHRAAAWPERTARFIANGLIESDDPFFFSNNIKTDYVWGIPENVPER